MRSSASLLALALASVSAVACSEPGPTGSSPVSPGSGTVLAVSNAPDASGPIVIRSVSGFFPFLVFDAKHALVAIHIARDGFGFCGEPFTLFHPAQFQDVLTPANADLIQELFRNDGVFVTIYAWAGQDILVDDDVLCDFLAGTPIARGTAHLLNTDNDLLGVPGRADAFGFTAQGTVDLTAGGTAHYNAFARWVYFPPDDVKVRAGITLVPLK